MEGLQVATIRANQPHISMVKNLTWYTYRACDHFRLLILRSLRICWIISYIYIYIYIYISFSLLFFWLEQQSAKIITINLFHILENWKICICFESKCRIWKVSLSNDLFLGLEWACKSLESYSKFFLFCSHSLIYFSPTRSISYMA